ncbi:MAG: hypothetical protein AABX65_04095 [Nanoarchaeota archaeon]
MKHAKTMLYPQEIEVFYIIPSLKKQLAIELKKTGLKQAQIAKIFHVKEASISQYLSSKRGSLVKFNPCVIQNIKNSVPKIKDAISLLSEIQKLLVIVRNSGELCRIHKQHSPIPMCCSPKLIGCFENEHK